MRNILLLILISSGIWCNHKDKSWTPGSGPNNSVYSKIEIFCLCFYDSADIKNNDGTFSSRNGSCETPIRVNASDLIKPEHFLDSTSNSNIIARLQKVIFNRNENAKAVFDGVDSRFLILFKKNEFAGDRFVCSSSNQFVYNEKYLFKYSFPIMDSIREILNKDKIDCK